MSDLHIMFLAVGALLFVLVVFFSYLQQRRSRTSSQKRPPEVRQKSNHDRAKSAEGDDQQVRVSPVVTDSMSSTTAVQEPERDGLANKLKNLGKEQKRAAAKKSSDSNTEQVAEVAHSKAVGNNESSSVDQSHQLIKSGDVITTELVAKVLNPDPVEQNNLLALFREHDFKFQRSVHIYGLNELTDLWRDIEFELSSARFLELGISIQLCDQDGAMGQRESHDFQQMVYQFCEKFDAPFEFSMDLDSALAQAQTLDRIARRYDSMAVLNVVPKSKSGFRMADIQSCARDLMMSTDKSGIFLKTEGQKSNITVLYRLACTDGDGHFGVHTVGQGVTTPVHDLVMYLKVPATPNPESVFQQMVSDANNLAIWLDGKVVDRSGKVMTQRTYSALMQQISDIAYSMGQDGLIPGDQVTKKLF